VQQTHAMIAGWWGKAAALSPAIVIGIVNR